MVATRQPRRSWLSLRTCPYGLTFTWWGCYGLCLRQKKKKPTELAHSFLRCSCVCFCHYDPFNCILFHKFSWHISCFSLCSSSLISALLVLSTIYHFMESLLQPWYNSKWLTGFKIAIYETNSLRTSSTVFLGLCLQDLSEIRRCRAYFKKKKKLFIYLFSLEQSHAFTDTVCFSF